jgi:hypothetical protein
MILTVFYSCIVCEYALQENIELYRPVLLESKFASIFQVLRRDREDAEVALFVLEIFLTMLKPHGSLPGVVSAQAEIASTVFLQADRECKILSILLEYLPGGTVDSDFKQDLGIFTLQIMEVLTASQPLQLAQACLLCVSGTITFINLLGSHIDGVRHQVLWIIAKLSAAPTEFRVVLAVQVGRRQLGRPHPPCSVTRIQFAGCIRET